MITIFSILFKTKDTLDYLDNQGTDELDTNCRLIFLFLGAFSGFASFYGDLDHFRKFFGENEVVFFWVLSTLLGAGLTDLIGRYLLTYILYGLGKLLQGVGSVIDIRLVAAYSLIPRFFELPIFLYFKLFGNINGYYGFEYWSINIFHFLISIWSFKILMQGIMRFNKLGHGKALLNISPILIVMIAPYLLYYIIRY